MLTDLTSSVNPNPNPSNHHAQLSPSRAVLEPPSQSARGSPASLGALCVLMVRTRESSAAGVQCAGWRDMFAHPPTHPLISHRSRSQIT